MDIDTSNTKIINLITRIHNENMIILASLLIHSGVPKETVDEEIADMDKKWYEMLMSE